MIWKDPRSVFWIEYLVQRNLLKYLFVQEVFDDRII